MNPIRRREDDASIIGLVCLANRQSIITQASMHTFYQNTPPCPRSSLRFSGRNANLETGSITLLALTEAGELREAGPCQIKEILTMCVKCFSFKNLPGMTLEPSCRRRRKRPSPIKPELISSLFGV